MGFLIFSTAVAFAALLYGMYYLLTEDSQRESTPSPTDTERLIQNYPQGVVASTTNLTSELLAACAVSREDLEALELARQSGQLDKDTTPEDLIALTANFMMNDPFEAAKAAGGEVVDLKDLNWDLMDDDGDLDLGELRL